MFFFTLNKSHKPIKAVKKDQNERDRGAGSNMEANTNLNLTPLIYQADDPKIIESTQFQPNIKIGTMILIYMYPTLLRFWRFTSLREQELGWKCKCKDNASCYFAMISTNFLNTSCFFCPWSQQTIIVTHMWDQAQNFLLSKQVHTKYVKLQ